MFVLFVYLSLSLVLLVNHESWRDEAQAWLIVRDIGSPVSLLWFMGYESTPGLWHLLIYPFAVSGFPFFTISVIHFIIAFSSVYIFYRYSPFSFVEKSLFIFGYFMFYEYSIIARNYVLTVFFLFLIAFFYRWRFEKPLFYSFFIFFLANTSVHGLIISSVFTILYLLEILLGRADNPDLLASGSSVFFIEFLSPREANYSRKHIAALLVIFLGLSISLIQVIPPNDFSNRKAEWHIDYSFLRVSDSVSNAIVSSFVPVPNPRIEFWNTLYLKKFFNKYYLPYPDQLWGILGLILFLASLFYFIDSGKPFLLYLFSCVFLLLLFILKYSSGIRHYGMFYLMFVTTYWIIRDSEKKSFKVSRIGLQKIFLSREVKKSIFIVILLFHILASCIAFYYDYFYDFSSAKRVASFLVDNGLVGKNVFIGTYLSPSASAILPYLEGHRNTFYYLEYRDDRSYMTWNHEYELNEGLSNKEFMHRVEKAVSGKDYEHVLLILNGNIVPVDKDFFLKYRLLRKFEGSVLVDESFYVYELYKS